MNVCTVYACECIRAIGDGKLKWQRISASLFGMNENEYADLSLFVGQFSPLFFFFFGIIS